MLGLSPTGLHVVRALGSTGIDVFGISEGFQCGRFSRFLGRCISDPAEERLSVLRHLFPEAANETQKPILIPTSDQAVAFIIDNAEELSRHYNFQDSYRDGIAAKILSKDSFYRLCATHRIRYPKSWEIPRERLLELLPSLTFPCLVKPSDIHRIKARMKGKKLWVARDAVQYRSQVEQIPSDAGTLVVQEIVPGPDSNITLCCAHFGRDGIVRQTFTGRKLRQFPPGFGSASLIQSCPDSETARVSVKFLSAIGYSGIAALEFKRHEVTGKLYMIETNVRPSLWFGAAPAAGRNVVLSAFRELAGLEGISEHPQIDGVRWRYLLKDLAAALFYRTHPHFVLPPPNLAAVGPPGARVGAVFERRDPGPAIADLMNFAGKFISRACRFPPLSVSKPRR